MEQNEEADDLRREWLGHEHTQKIAREREASAKKKLDTLKAVCRETTDPKVARAYSEYVAEATFAEYLRGAK